MLRNLQAIMLGAFIMLHVQAQAQQETQNWYFSTKAGLSFASNPPVAVTNGSVNNAEGSASMSDATGALLFYTDGVTVYNKNHLVMANGTGLMGDYSSTQSAVIVKKPGSATLYYIFTTDDAGTGGMNGLNYSIVDMALAASLGSVTVKNANLYAPSCEKVAAVKHCNGSDIWILSHELTTNVFRNFLLGSNGVNTTAVTSAVGTTITNNAAIGQLKVSPNGRRVGVAIFDGNIPPQPPPPNVGGFEVYDFDPATGIVSNPLLLYANMSAYGCEFSPDCSKFYGTLFSGDEMYQWDLCAGSGPGIVSSKYTIIPTGTGNNFGSMQLALNGKIYIVQKQKQNLSIINSPNSAGSLCNYTSLNQSLGQKTSDLNLPNFMSSYFKEPSPLPPPFTYTLTCTGTSFTPGSVSNATCSASNNPVSAINWLFGDPSSGNNNSSTVSNPLHLFSSPGTYTVKCIYMHPCSSDTVIVPVTVSAIPVPTLNVAGTFTICKGETRTYTVSGASSYQWSNNSTASTITLNPNVTTTYSVTGTGSSGCQATQVITITVEKCTGIATQNEIKNIRLYPNPFEESLRINTDKETTLSIFSQVGALLFEQTFAPGEHIIDTTCYPEGFYFITAKAGNIKENLRFIKTGR